MTRGLREGRGLRSLSTSSALGSGTDLRRAALRPACRSGIAAWTSAADHVARNK